MERWKLEWCGVLAGAVLAVALVGCGEESSVGGGGTTGGDLESTVLATISTKCGDGGSSPARDARILSPDLCDEEMDVLEIILTLERELGVKIPDDQFMQLDVDADGAPSLSGPDQLTVQQLIDLVKAAPRA